MDTEKVSVSYHGERVRVCTDGKYRWTYSVNMLKNPSIFITVCKIFGILGGIAFLIASTVMAVHGEWEELLGSLKYWGIAVLVFLGIAILSYLIVAKMYGFRYIVDFTMDEKGIRHEQTMSQKKNAKKIGVMLGAAGAATGNIGRIGQGMMVANHTSLSSDFSRVRSVKSFRRLCTIKLNEPFAHNQVYTTPEDYDFVLQFIKSHCPKVQ